MTNSLYDALAAGLDSTPDAPLIAHSAAGRFSYREFFGEVRQLASGIASLGIFPGNRIVVIAPKSVRFLQLYMASLAAGAVLVPVNPASTRHEVQHVLDDARPRIVVASRDRLDDIAELCEQIGGCKLVTIDGAGADTLHHLQCRASSQTPVAERSSEDIAAVLYTSGTTGTPKGVTLSHRALESNSNALCRLWRFSAQDVLIHALPAFHTHGLFVATNIALMAGASLHLVERFSTQEVIDAIPRATAFMGVPAMYTRLLQHPSLSPQLAARFRLFVSGSAPLLEQTHRQWEARTGHRILERYGMTEANMIMSNPYEGRRLPGTVGFPLPGVMARICDPECGTVVQPGRIGILEIASDGLFSGYFGAPEQTRQAYRNDGYFVTGDLARQDTNGYFVIEGRADDLIISGGYNVYPKEVETVIDRVPGVVESAVIGVPHADFGQGVLAVVECRHTGTGLEAKITAEAKEHLTGYKRPKQIILRPRLPRNSLGKVQKSVLRNEYQKVFA